MQVFQALVALLFVGVVKSEPEPGALGTGGWGWNNNNNNGPVNTGKVCFYENPYCSGHHYTAYLGNGECQTLPKGICDWNLSLKTSGGQCIKVYENDGCQDKLPSSHALYPTWFRGGNSRVIKSYQCTSTKLNGLTTVRSFRKCAC